MTTRERSQQTDGEDLFGIEWPDIAGEEVPKIGQNRRNVSAGTRELGNNFRKVHRRNHILIQLSNNPFPAWLLVQNREDGRRIENNLTHWPALGLLPCVR